MHLVYSRDGCLCVCGKVASTRTWRGVVLACMALCVVSVCGYHPMHAQTTRLVCAPTTCRKLKPTPPPPPPPPPLPPPTSPHTRPHPRGCRNGCMHPPPHPSTPKWVCVWASCTHICMCCNIPPIHPTQPHHAPWRRGRAAPTHPHMRACMHAPHTTPHIQTHKGGCNLVQGCCCWAMHAYI
jgi:hypothetical protein